MRHVLAVLLLLGCLLPGMAWGEDIFWWDVRDSEITTVSSGTGGASADRPEVSQRRFVMDSDALDSLPPCVSDAWESWQDAVYEELWVESGHWSLMDGRLLQEALRGEDIAIDQDAKEHWYLYDWQVRTLMLDMATGERLALSDLFYDGVNYIAYINAQAGRALTLETYATEWDDEEHKYILGEDDLRRPFSGFPRDYPYFRVTVGPQGGRMLALELCAENPLFRIPETAGYPVLFLPLPDTLSPYGARWVEVVSEFSPLLEPSTLALVDEKLLPYADPGLYTARVEPGSAVMPEVATRINAQLRALGQAALQHPNRALHDDYYALYPEVLFGEHLLCASYDALTVYIGSNTEALLGAVCLDLDTGEPLDGERVYSACRTLPKAVFYQVTVSGRREWTEIEPYDPPEGAQFLGMWWSYVRYFSDATLLQMAWLDPAGYEVHLMIPYEDAAGTGLVPAYGP